MIQKELLAWPAQVYSEGEPISVARETWSSCRDCQSDGDFATKLDEARQNITKDVSFLGNPASSRVSFVSDFEEVGEDRKGVSASTN